MALSTRSTARPSTPVRSSRPGEYDIIKKARFFDAYNSRIFIRAIAAVYAQSLITTHRWLKERAQLRSLGLRMIRKLSKNVGPRLKVLAKTCKMLVLLARNPVRD